MAFHFRFQTLLNYRNRMVEEYEQAVARQQQTLYRLRQQLQRLQREREQALEQLKPLLYGSLPADALEHGYRYLGSVERQIEAQQAHIRRGETELEQLRQALTEALQARKVLEKLKEYDQAAYEAEVRRQETAALDDLSIARYRRTRTDRSSSFL